MKRLSPAIWPFLMLGIAATFIAGCGPGTEEVTQPDTNGAPTAPEPSPESPVPTAAPTAVSTVTATAKPTSTPTPTPAPTPTPTPAPTAAATTVPQAVGTEFDRSDYGFFAAQSLINLGHIPLSETELDCVVQLAWEGQRMDLLREAYDVTEGTGLSRAAAELFGQCYLRNDAASQLAGVLREDRITASEQVVDCWRAVFAQPESATLVVESLMLDSHNPVGADTLTAEIFRCMDPKDRPPREGGVPFANNTTADRAPRNEAGDLCYEPADGASDQNDCLGLGDAYAGLLPPELSTPAVIDCLNDLGGRRAESSDVDIQVALRACVDLDFEDQTPEDQTPDPPSNAGQICYEDPDTRLTGDPCLGLGDAYAELIPDGLITPDAIDCLNLLGQAVPPTNMQELDVAIATCVEATAPSGQ